MIISSSLSNAGAHTKFCFMSLRYLLANRDCFVAGYTSLQASSNKSPIHKLPPYQARRTHSHTVVTSQVRASCEVVAFVSQAGCCWVVLSFYTSYVQMPCTAATVLHAWDVVYVWAQAAPATMEKQETAGTHPTQAAVDACFTNDISPEQVQLFACTCDQSDLGLIIILYFKAWHRVYSYL